HARRSVDQRDFAVLARARHVAANLFVSLGFKQAALRVTARLDGIALQEVKDRLADQRVIVGHFAVTRAVEQAQRAGAVADVHRHLFPRRVGALHVVAQPLYDLGGWREFQAADAFLLVTGVGHYLSPFVNAARSRAAPSDTNGEAISSLLDAGSA